MFDISSKVANDITVEEVFTPSMPSEPENVKNLDDRQNVYNIAACGCNIASKILATNQTYWYSKEFLKFSYKKLGLIINNGALLSHDVENVYMPFIRNFVANTPEDKWRNVVAFLLKDEPSTASLIANKGTVEIKKNNQESDYIVPPLMHCYKRLAETIRDTEGLEGMILINLAPIHGFGTATKYQQHLTAFQEFYHPAMYSVDVYPVLQWNPLVVQGENFSGFKQMRAGDILQVHERFYRTLEMVSAQARKHNRPFWYYLLTGEHFHPTSFYYPAQKEEYIRYSAFTALAYGAKALVHWRMLENLDDRKNLFTKPGEEGYANESYMRHPINSDRTRSPFWYYVRRVNKEIKRYQDIFMNSEVKGIFHTGLEALAQYALAHYSESTSKVLPYVFHGYEPEVTEPIIPEVPTAEVWGLRPHKSTSIPVFESIESPEGGLGVVVSHMATPDGTEYIMIVNHDAANVQKIRITFTPGYNLNELTPQNSEEGRKSRFINTTTTSGIERLLTPGGYLIFQRMKLSIVP